MESNLSRFDELLRTALADGTFGKMTLGKPRAPDSDLRNVHVRPVRLKTGPQFSFVYRHRTRDVTKNHPADSTAREISRLLADTFFDAHLFTTTRQVQLELQPDGTARLRSKTVQAGTQPESHDRTRQHSLDPHLPWLRALGVTNDRGQPREGMAAKFRQIQKFTELIDHLSAEAHLPTDRPWRIADMGCGKGYLTFAVATLLGAKAVVQGIERRADLVDLTNRIARECNCSNLEFTVGDIGTTTPAGIDMLIALHACDTATDDALAAGIASGAALLVVSPCCQKELRPQLTAPPRFGQRPAARHFSGTSGRIRHRRAARPVARNRGLPHQGLRVCFHRAHRQEPDDRRHPDRPAARPRTGGTVARLRTVLWHQTSKTGQIAGI